jgi:hypothetical protein
MQFFLMWRDRDAWSEYTGSFELYMKSQTLSFLSATRDPSWNSTKVLGSAQNDAVECFCGFESPRAGFEKRAKKAGQFMPGIFVML